MDGDASDEAVGRSPQRSGPRLIVAAAILAGFVILGAGAFVALALHNNPHGAAGTLLNAAIGGPFKLVDQNGNTVTNTDLKGKWLLVYFGYTHCPDACPTALNNISLALSDLGPDKKDVRPVFITVDPERDTSKAMKDYVSAFDAPILALTGSAASSSCSARARLGPQEHDPRDAAVGADAVVLHAVGVEDEKPLDRLQPESTLGHAVRGVDGLPRRVGARSAGGEIPDRLLPVDVGRRRAGWFVQRLAGAADFQRPRRVPVGDDAGVLPGAAPGSHKGILLGPAF